MSYNKLIAPLIVLVVGLAVILWIVAAKFVTRHQSASGSLPPSQTTTATIAEAVHPPTTPAPASLQQERENRAKASAQASEQFGAALERISIKTQKEASH